MSNSQLYPPIYSTWLSKRFPKSVQESLATCDSCAMVRPTGITRDPGPFEAHLKCCTYFPFVPNFGLGTMLGENSKALLLRIQTAEAQGILVPMGLYATPERQQMMEDRAVEGFGRQSDLLCPFFDTKSLGCSVWQFRPGVCTTYFCKSDRGADGLDFWNDVENYLNHFEWVMASEVCRRLGVTDHQIEMIKAVMTTSDGDEERNYFLQESWGPWFNRKFDFYLEAHKISLHVQPQEIDSLLAEEVLELEESLRQRS